MKGRNIENFSEIMTIGQLACYLSVTPLTIKRKIATDSFPLKAYWVYKPRRQRVFYKKDVQSVYNFTA